MFMTLCVYLGFSRHKDTLKLGSDIVRQSVAGTPRTVQQTAPVRSLLHDFLLSPTSSVYRSCCQWGEQDIAIPVAGTLPARQQSPLWGLSPRPYAYEAHALPAELRRQVLIFWIRP